MTRWKPYFGNIIWPTLGNLDFSYAWRVRILFFKLYCDNLCPAGMQIPGQKCAALIEMTANALSHVVLNLMLVAVQKDNLELSIKEAVKR